MNAQNRILLLFTLVILLFCAPLFGAQNPNTTRGFAADGVFQFNDVDHINIFNGGLTLSLPIGQSYTAGDRLKYSIGLSYNSAIWDHIPHSSTEGELTETVPNRSSNAGVGWMLSLGELLIGDEIEYVSPDGTQHSFKASTLHFGDDIRDGDSVLYSRDGSYLRMRKVINGTQHLRIIDFPDGTSKEFLCVSTCGQLTNSVTKFHLQKISDPFGNEVTIVRDPEPQGNNLPLSTTWTWTVREKSEGGHATEHYIVHQFNANAPYRWIVKEVQMEVSPSSFTPDQAITERRRALYQFHYGNTEETTTLFRHTAHIAPKGLTITQPNNLKRLVVPMLQSVELPDGSSWSFRYRRSQDNDEDVIQPFPGRAYWSATLDGVLDRFTYPTGGGVRYEYGTYSYPRRTCFPGGGGPADRPRAAISTGIRRRWLVKPNGQDEGEPWRYISSTNRLIDNQDGTWPYECEPAHTFRTTVVDPLANVTVNYFSIFVNGMTNEIGAQAVEYGLPFTRAIPDPLNNNRFISTKVFQCSTTNHFNPDFTQRADLYLNAADPSRVCGTAKRESYVRYESSGLDCPPYDDEYGPGCLSANRRLAEERIVFKDDGDSWTLTQHTDFDGLGHYRETHVSGNFYDKNFPNSNVTRPHGDHKASRQEWNDGVDFDAGAQTFTGFPGVNQRWLLGTYTATARWEVRNTSDPKDSAAHGATARVQYKFDSSGFLTHMRTLKGNAPGPTDVLVTYEREDAEAGRIRVKERYWGGDGKNLDTGELGSFTPSDADYAIDLTYRFGSLERKEYKSCSGNATILLVERNEIDPATGLTMSTRDAGGAITSFLYDTSNRLKETRPPGEAKTVYTYTNFGANNASVTAVREDGTSKKPETKWEFDPWGRLSAEMKRIADGTWNRREVRYYTNGWKKEETTTGPNGTTNAGITQYTSYDPFGRTLEIIHPDSDARTHKTNFTYLGDRVVTKTVTGVAVNTQFNGTATSTQLFDPHGRMVAVTELSNQQTTYEYDSSDRLYKVLSGVQVRTFDTDNRGFLISEKYPEIGANGITWGKYDARGNVHEKYYGGTGNRHELDLTFVYDAAERLTLVKQPAFSNRPLKSIGYYTNTNGGTHNLGRLRQTQRYNYIKDPAGTQVDKPAVIVTKLFTYWPANHRPRTVRVTAPGVRFTTTYNYDNLGNVSSIQYPRLTVNCNPSATCLALGPDLTVPYGYSYGFLTAVPGFIDSITYHPNEMPYKVKHANNVTWIQDVPLRHLTRTTNIRLENVAAGGVWNTGSYRYDALGSIFKIDSDEYTYDTANRLVKSAMSGGTQNFDYDRYGNITNFAGAALSPDPATNRLGSTIATYDIAGNMKTYKDPRQAAYQYAYEYDAFNNIHHVTAFAGQVQKLGRMYLYDAGDERVAIIDYLSARPNIQETWSARDLANSVIRDFVRTYDASQQPPGGQNPANRGWVWSRDYVFRGTTVAASIDNTGITHVHVDHLGSERVTTNGTRVAGPVRTYKPFGEEVVSTPDPIRLKFTGHERDDAGGDLLYGDLDYMHARYYNPGLGRFLSRDPIMSAKLPKPQTWNKYTYARNNPLIYVDPNGEDSFLVSRPLSFTSRGSHMFIVTHADYPGDPKGKVYSYGAKENGNLGRVDDNTRNSSSEGTHASDKAAWLALADPAKKKEMAVHESKIDAPDNKVQQNATSMIEDQDYAASGLGGVNSNSAATAIAEESSGKQMDPPGDRAAPAANSSDKIQFDRNKDGKPDKREFTRKESKKKNNKGSKK